MIRRTRARHSTGAVGFSVISLAALVTLAGITWPLPATADLTCDRWRPVNPLPITEDLNGVAYRDGVYLAVGDHGAMLASTDEVSWQVANSGVEVDLNSVIDLPDGFVVVGDGGTILLGTLDEGWTTASSGTTADLLDVDADGGDVLIAVGSEGVILHSSDGGETWSDQGPGGSLGLLGVAWTGSGFIAVGEGGSILRSATGSVWSRIDLGVESDFNAVASDGGQALAIAADGTIAVITDDDARISESIQSGVTDLVWYGDRFLTAGWLRHSFDGVIWHTSDATGLGPGTRAIGPSWMAGGSPPSAIIVGPGGTIGHSTDGAEHWKPSNTLSGTKLNGLAATDDLAVAVGGDSSFFAYGLHGSILVSDDLDHWEVAHRSGNLYTDVAAGSEMLMVTGMTPSTWGWYGFVQWSADGRTWEEADVSTTEAWSLYSITWDGEQWIAAGGGGAVLVSSDGLSWDSLSAEGYPTFRGVASDRSVIVAVGQEAGTHGGGAIAVSSDGSNLGVIGVQIDHPLYDVAFGNGVFIAVGEAGTILSSSDGLTWLPRPSGLSSRLVGVRWDGASFTAVGDGGVALVSPDGTTWLPLDLGTQHDLTDFMASQMGRVASGDHGLLLRPDGSTTGDPPVAGFTWRPSVPEAGTPVRFIDLSTGDPTGWSWDFGDGVTAPTPSATHVFADHGEWPVSLRAENVAGSGTTTAMVSVRRFCGAPPRMTLNAPTSVASSQPYTVSWDPVFNMWEEGSYYLIEDTTPSLDDPYRFGLRVYSTSVEQTHLWSDGGVIFTRGRAINHCPDGTYFSKFSNIVQTDIIPELADLGEHSWTIPAAASSGGFGNASWITDVAIHNPDDYDAPAYLVHLPRAGEGEAALGERLTVPTRSSLNLDDAMAEFGADATGALLIASDRPLQVISRTYNDQANGTFGQFIDGTPLAGALDPDRIGTMIQLTQDEGARTNLALANPLPDDVMVDVDAFDATGAPLGSSSYTVPGLGSIFESRFLERFTTDPVADAYAVVTPLSPEGKVLALASVVDKRTGDPSTQTTLPDHLRHRGIFIGEMPDFDATPPNGLVFAHGRWVFAGTGGLLVSDDGLFWQRVSETRMNGVEFNGSQILAFGWDLTMTSDDGEIWDTHNTTGIYPKAVCWDGVQWFALTGVSGASIATSPDGVVWMDEVIEEVTLYSIIHDGERYFGGTVDGIAHSLDGRVWQTIDLGMPKEWVEWNGSQYLAGSRTRLATSTDGMTWTVQSPGFYLGGAVWAGDRWVVGAEMPGSKNHTGYLVSFDGETWAPVRMLAEDAFEAGLLGWNGELVMGIHQFYDYLSFLVGDTPVTAVPAVAHVDGFAGARWRSDLELHNPHDGAVDCTIELLERDGANHQPDFRNVTVGASASVRLADIVGDTFSTDGAGALRITPNGNTILVSSRTYDDADDGTYGQQVPGLRGSDAIWYFEEGRLIGLAHSPTRSEGFRTNIGLVSACASPMDVEIELFDGEGRSLGTTHSFFQAYGVHQLNDVFRQMTDDQVTNGWAVVRTPTAQCSFYAYASVVDNRTNDPTLIPASH